MNTSGIVLTRREMLHRSGLGLAGFGLSAMAGKAFGEGQIAHPLEAKRPHFLDILYLT